MVQQKLSSSEEKDRAVAEVFDAFCQAVKKQDFAAYHQLHTEQAQEDLERALFISNAEKAQRHSFRFQLLKVVHEGDVAEVTFEVVPGDGAEEQRDQSTLVMVWEESGFKIDES